MDKRDERTVSIYKMVCPECGSSDFVPHTDSELRANQNNLYQCFSCNSMWITHWKIVEEFVCFLEKNGANNVESEEKVS